MLKDSLGCPRCGHRLANKKAVAHLGCDTWERWWHRRPGSCEKWLACGTTSRLNNMSIRFGRDARSMRLPAMENAGRQLAAVGVDDIVGGGVDVGRDPDELAIWKCPDIRILA